MNHYIPIIAPSRYIPMVAPSKVTKMSPQDTLIAPTETVIVPIDVFHVKETLTDNLDGLGFVIAPIDVHHSTETLLDGQGLWIDGKGLILDGKTGFSISTAAHGVKTPKKKTKKIKAAGLEGTAVAGTEGHGGGISPGGGGVKPGPVVLIKSIDPDWFKCGVKGTTAKPYGGDIKPCDPDLPKITVRIEGAGDGWPGGEAKPGIIVKIAAVDPGSQDITPGYGGGGIYPLPPWPKGGSDEITVRTEKWGGENCHEVFYGVGPINPPDDINTGGGTGCKPVNPPLPPHSGGGNINTGGGTGCKPVNPPLPPHSGGEGCGG